MVGGPGQATDCSFSITLGILLAEILGRRQGKGMDLRQRGLTLAAALLLLATYASLGEVTTGSQVVAAHAARPHPSPSSSPTPTPKPTPTPAPPPTAPPTPPPTPRPTPP